ncbi:T9SS type B sorting domain-containing protein [Nonlabens xiamenensis]|uniref:T9SS type B sorting domain-containing protein n=1 Tax=Nonlabens xiamenensis TaxID=2341043 RepID=UPI000F6081EF|nr:T9SS type B sorting domain-containing protein [Nonlabens xiamenensis]
MRRKTLVLLLFFMISLGFMAQAQLQASNWYFGFNAGISFDPATGAVTALTDGQVSTNEGCASISDENGQLLFYTDGTVVFDRSHQIMQNGQGLRGNPSSTQSAIIIPKPQNPDIYYIFTVDNPVGRQGGGDGVNYYEVDMTLNLGMGAVTTNIANPPQLLFDSSEKLTAINHATNDEIFVTTLASAGGGATFDTFYTYKVGVNGVDPIPVQSTVASPVSERRGNLKFSPDGRFLVSCNMTAGTYIYDFDQTTGAVSNERRVQVNAPNIAGYGVEFSPDSSLLYVTASNDAQSAQATAHNSSLYQYELTPQNLSNVLLAGTVIDQRQGYRGSLQLGLDGRIYRALSESYNSGRGFLGVINNPNVPGPGCNYQHDAIPLAGRLSTQGLPPFIQSFFALIQVENTCFGDATTFEFQTDTPPTSVLWDFGDGTTSSLENPDHIYATPGIYNVTLTLTTGGASRVYRKNVQIFESPVANAPTDINVCDLGQDTAETIDLANVISPQVLGTQDPTIFNVSYFVSDTDAMDNMNELSLPYTLTQPSVRLYARIANNNNADCFDLVDFELRLFEQPIANPTSDLEQCDDDFDGLATFDLRSQDQTILAGQDPNLFDISYHRSQADADAGQQALPDLYTNETPFNQTVFVRIQNRNEQTCEDTTQSFVLIVHPKPVAIDSQAFQCDEDGTPDGRTIFNLSNFDSTVSAAATGVDVQYYLNQTDADQQNNPLDKNSFTNATAMQVVTARVTDTTTGCYTLSQITLSVSASDAQDTSLESCDDDGTEDGFALFDLNNADSDVLANAPAGVQLNYYANYDEALTEQNPLPVMFTNTTAFNQTIFARAESADGNCYGIAEIELVVNPLPNIERVELIDYCGNDPQPLQIDSGLLQGTPSDYSYLWSTGEMTESITVSTGGNYQVTVTDANGCSQDREVTVIISEPATIDAIDIVHAGSGTQGSITAVVSGLGSYEYRISLDEPYQDSPLFLNVPPGFHTLYVRDKNGCGVTTQEFSIVGYPRFFTPNSDGYNDFWQLSGVSNVFEPNTQIFIFDRYGKLLKQISPEGPGWDGTFNGTPLPSSDYWFKATLLDGTTFAAHFTLKR